MADKIIVSKSKVTNLFDSIRAKSGSTDLMSFDTAKESVDGIQTGGGVIEVEELPQVGWSGTAVPNSGAYTDIYFNINLSKEEVNPILNQVTFLDSSLLGQSGFGFYPIATFSIGYISGALVMKKFSDDDIDVAIVDLSTFKPTRDIFVGSDGWDATAISDKKLPLGTSSEFGDLDGEFTDNFNGLPVGTQNDLISSVFSSTPFVKEEPVEGSIYKVKPTGTAVPDSGYVEKVYVNTWLPGKEIVDLFNKLTIADIPNFGKVYPIIANQDVSKSILILPWYNSDGSGGERLDYYLIQYNNELICSTDVHTYSISWKEDINVSELECGYETAFSTAGPELGLEYQNEKLKNLFSITPFAEPKLYIYKNGEFVELSEGSSGETTTPTPPKDPTSFFVKIVDYDGEILYDRVHALGDVIELPTPPTHDRLVFQEWSATTQIVNNTITVPKNNVLVGATYTTASGACEFDIRLTKVTGLTVTMKSLTNMTSIDWGDGTTDSTLTHTYSAEGDYTIKVYGVGLGLGQYIFSQSSSKINYYLLRSRLNSVTSIGSYSFSYCYSLAFIVIPNGVTSIGNSSFSYCDSLTSIVIPNGVTNIDNNSFSGCRSLTSIVIPNGVTSIGGSSFNTCLSLASIVIPNGVTSIGDYSFSGCYHLASIVIPNGVTNIGNNLFQTCYSLASIVIPNGVTSIGKNSFSNCYSLASIVIPNSVTSIVNGSFNSCYSLTSIVIPNGVTSIGNGLFSNCHSLTSIVIPNGVTSIGDYSFQTCYSLASIVIPNGVTNIGNNSFNNCFSVLEYDLSKLDSIPTLSNTNAFNNINKACKFYVKPELLEQFKTATNWSTYADYFYVKE